MNVGISTFHFAPNSGAMLQCYALQRKLESMGHTVKILDYRPYYHTDRYVAFRNPFNHGKGLMSFAKNVYYNRNVLQRSLRNKKFREFENLFHLTQHFVSCSQFVDLSLKPDAIICGSDQIWNKCITNHVFDPVYFADFPGYTGTKISYAASIGETNIEENAEELGILLSGFKAISVRESSSAERLGRVLDRNVSTVPDPTLLLEKSDYIDLLTPIDTPERYLLVYFFGHNHLLPQIISAYRRKIKIPIISISPYRIVIHDKYKWINNLGPNEFLSYINNAEAVVTNSFHCSLFSTLFQKKLFVVKNGNRSERMSNLFESLNLDHIMLENEEDIKDAIDLKIDYSNINNSLQTQRKIGESFLAEALNSDLESKR